MKIKSIIALVFLWISTIAMAQETKPVSLQFEARADYQRTDIDGKHIKNESGFKGYIVNIILKGDISPKFSYAFRNRLNGINKDYNFFNSTDWLYLKYKPNKNVAIMQENTLYWWRATSCCQHPSTVISYLNSAITSLVTNGE